MSVLALIHPDGAADFTVLGSGCPPGLAGTGGSGLPPGLIIIAPDEKEGSDPEWLDGAVRRAAAELEADGLVYVLGRLRTRCRLARLLRARKLEPCLRMLHLPHWKVTRYLIPVDCDAVRFAYDRLVPGSRGAGGRLSASVRRVIACLGLGALMPDAVSVWTRPGSRPPLAWLRRMPSDEQRDSTAVFRLKPRDGETRIVLHRIEIGSGPTHVLKTATGRTGTEFDREASVLTRMRGVAEAAGARVPQVDPEPGIERFHVQSVVTGRPAAVVLSKSPEALFPILEELTNWLIEWNRATLHPVTLDRALMRRLMSDPDLGVISRVGLSRTEAEAYRAWLHALMEKLEGRSVPLVSAHNDLTMENIIVEPRRSVGIVDWESAEEDSPPLTDFYYAAVNAVVASDRELNWIDGIRSCFSPDGAYRSRIRKLESRLQENVGVGPEFRLLCFHRCWIEHAGRKRSETGSQRFDGTVRTLTGPAFRGEGADDAGHRFPAEESQQ